MPPRETGVDDVDAPVSQLPVLILYPGFAGSLYKLPEWSEGVWAQKQLLTF